MPSPAGSERWPSGSHNAGPYLAYDAPGGAAAAWPAPRAIALPGDAAQAPAAAAPVPEAAYAACSAIIREHSASFYFSARLLPPAKRAAILALYAFCRTSDELVDRAAERGLDAAATAEALAAWAARCRPLYPAPGEADPVVLAWADTRRRFGIPQAPADELLAGVSMDISIARYATWADLWMYCYRVASTVGQMSMRITGALDPTAANYAIKLGIALQLTNILRDVGEDARQGRIYLPLADLARFGYTPDDLQAGRIDDRFVALMRFEIARARALYAEAWPGIALLPRDSRLAVAVAARVYRAILARIEANGYDVFSRRARVPTAGKLMLLADAWRRVRLGRDGRAVRSGAHG